MFEYTIIFFVTCWLYFTLLTNTNSDALQRRKIEESGEKKGNHESKKRKKPQNHQAQDQQQPNSQPDLDLLRRKEKNETTDAEGGTGNILSIT